MSDCTVTLTVETAEGTYSVSDCGSDRKPWIVERTGYHYPIAAFHERHEAEAYCLKTIARRGLVEIQAGAA
jgi:hypothetical protein